MAIDYSGDLVNFIMDATLAQSRLIRGPWQKSTLPYVRECEDASGSSWEMDYQWMQESPDDMPVVQSTALRLVTHSGTEYTVKLRDVCPRWLAECESLAADDVAERNDASCQSLRDGE
jgi:hypothetical protein